MSAVGHEVVYRSDCGVDTRSLRHAVLHPDPSRDAASLPAGSNAAALHVGAFKGDVQVGVGGIVVAAL